MVLLNLLTVSFQLLALTSLLPGRSPDDDSLVRSIIEPNIRFYTRNSEDLQEWFDNHLRVNNDFVN